jgi:hypothetical protein
VIQRGGRPDSPIQNTAVVVAPQRLPARLHRYAAGLAGRGAGPASDHWRHADGRGEEPARPDVFDTSSESAGAPTVALLLAGFGRLASTKRIELRRRVVAVALRVSGATQVCRRRGSEARAGAEAGLRPLSGLATRSRQLFCILTGRGSRLRPTSGRSG